MAPKILIIGATGTIGKPITHQIIAASSSFERIAILTSTNTLNNKKDELKALTAQGVDALVGDLGIEVEVKKAYEGMFE
jgi:nucleoside-diphosphate-sugar epimerase